MAKKKRTGSDIENRLKRAFEALNEANESIRELQATNDDISDKLREHGEVLTVCARASRVDAIEKLIISHAEAHEKASEVEEKSPLQKQAETLRLIHAYFGRFIESLGIEPDVEYHCERCGTSLMVPRSTPFVECRGCKTGVRMKRVEKG